MVGKEGNSGRRKNTTGWKEITVVERKDTSDWKEIIVVEIDTGGWRERK